jgi:predicted small lipoprotein YifL
MKKIILLAVVVLSLSTLSGCQSTGLNPLAIPDAFTNFESPEVKFTLPSQKMSTSTGISGISFDSFHNGPSSSQQKLNWKIIDKNTLEVHRREDNGIAGSGVMYKVNYKIDYQGDDLVVTFKPISSKVYQQGFIGKKDVPNFDITEFLSTAVFEHKFEINSEYPADSIKANFERLLPKKQTSPYEMKEMMMARMAGKKVSVKDWYVLQLDTSKTWIQVESFPYRKGSKVVITTKVNTAKSANNTIDVKQVFNEIEKKVASIVNS